MRRQPLERDVFAGVGSPLTYTHGAGINGPLTNEELDRLETFYRDRNSPVVINLCPLCDQSLLSQLSMRGYHLAGFSNVLVRPLRTGESFERAAFLVRHAKPEESSLWTRCATKGFLADQAISPDALEVGEVLFAMETTECFFAEVEGDIGATAAMATEGDVAVFFADSTLVQYRGRGIHSALIRHRLTRTIALGCDAATASVLPGSASHRNYERAGFQLAFTSANLIREYE